MKKILAIILSIAFCVPSFAQSALYPLPASWSFRAVASFSQPRISKRAEALPDYIGADGEIYVLASEPFSLLYRHDGSSWEQLGGGGGGDAPTVTGLPNATDNLSLPVWLRGADSWQPIQLLSTSTSAMDAKIPFSVTASGTLRYVTSSTGPKLMLPKWIGHEYDYWHSAYVNVGPAGDYNIIEVQAESAGGALGAEVAGHVFDRDSSTFIKLVCPGQFGGIKVDNDNYVEELSTDSWKYIDGYAFQLGPNASNFPASWAFQYCDSAGDVNNGLWTTIATHGPFINPAPGAWYVSTTDASFTTDAYHRFYRLKMEDSGSGYVEIAEFRILDTKLTEEDGSAWKQWVDLPPATPTTTLVYPTTATPTTPATGTLWMDGNQSPPVMKAWDGTSWNSLW